MAGIVRTERAYLEAFRAYLQTGRDPFGGVFGYRRFTISASKYDAAMAVVTGWNRPYSLRCMCGTFAQQAIGAAGYRVGSSGAEPVNLYAEFAGTDIWKGVAASFEDYGR